jgi:SAM-dependent methyltransferase
VTTPDSDTLFSGSIPKLYERYLVPLIFEPYAEDLAARVATTQGQRVLEVAAGTGVVTRALAARLPADATIVATDLNLAMLQEAQSIGVPRPIDWKQADAMALPFGDAEFDTVICQFGVMFMPDKGRAFAEVRRVLRPDGRFVFNVWGGLDANDIARIVHHAVALLFPADPPGFLGRTPYAYFHHDVIARDLGSAGFNSPASFDVVSARSRARAAEDAAIGYVQGTPLRGEIEARDKTRLAEATSVAARAIAEALGSGPIDAGIEAHVVTVSR